MTGYLHIRMAYPPGWLQLPVADSAKIEHDRKLEAWAEEKAREMLGPESPRDDVVDRMNQLAELTVTCRARKDRYGFAFYPDRGEGLAAILDVQELTPSREHGAITFDLLEKTYAKHTREIVGDIASTRVDLPSGPALRVRRKQIEEPDAQGQGPLTESVTYAIHPTGLTNAVVMIMTWMSLQAGDEFAEMGDAIAQTIRVSQA
jgi:hypothetical protein